MTPSSCAPCKSILVAVLGAAMTLTAFAQPQPANASAPAGPAPALSPGQPATAAPLQILPPNMSPASPSSPGLAPVAPSPGNPAAMSPGAFTLPKFLEGVVTVDEYQALLKFQQKVNEEPASKELLAKIIALRQQVQQLQTELAAVRNKAVVDNPEMKAIADKIQAAMLAHGPMPSMPPPSAGRMSLPPSMSPAGQPTPPPTPPTAPASKP